MLRRFLFFAGVALLAAPAFARSPAYSFTEVNPRVSTPAFRAYIQSGLAVLGKSRRAIARGTLWAIQKGLLRLDTLSDLTRADYRRVRRDLLKDGVRIGADDFVRLHDQRNGAARAIRRALDGYQWDDRIYIAEGLSPARLAAVLVHEVNHVLNRSEEHYRGARAILLEEYRALYAEKLLAGASMTKERCRRLKQGLIRDYGIRGVTPDDVADVPPGRFYPPGWRGQ
jgi:hypothetical protein